MRTSKYTNQPKLNQSGVAHLLLIGVIIFALVAGFIAKKVLAQDTTAPTLTSWDISPEVVSTASQPVTAVVRAKIVETESLLDKGTVIFSSPGGVQTVESELAGADCGDYEATMNFPLNSSPGNWTAQVTLLDSAGNSRTYTNTALSNAGFDARTSMVGGDVQDNKAPSFKNPNLDPSTVAVGSAEADTFAQADISDDKSGIDKATITYRSPSAAQTVSADYAYSCGSFLHFETRITVPQGSEIGTWTPTVEVWDVTGNKTTVTTGIPNLTVTN